MSKKNILAAAAAALISLISFVAFDACGNIADCHAICSRYQGCFDDSYDVDACVDRCEKASADDHEYAAKANDCDACMEKRDCVASAFNCNDECSDVVP
jgi:hypothetical protein